MNGIASLHQGHSSVDDRGTMNTLSGPHAPGEFPRRPVRVLFINDTSRNGGPGRSLHSILKFLDPNVVHRSVVLPREGAIADLLARDGVADEIRFESNLVENPIEPWDRAMERKDFDAPVALKGIRVAGNVVKVALALRNLSSRIRRERFNLIYCNGTNADFAGAALASLTGVPALWHVRYTAVPPAVRALHQRLSETRGVRRIICVSQASAALFPAASPKVKVIHNALDVSAFDPGHVQGTLRRELGLGSDAIIFGSHGRVLRRKGYVEMIRAAHSAMPRLRQAVPDGAPVVFVVVGDTPDDFRPDHVEECRALISELGLSDRFFMLGFRPDVRPLVADFDVAVVPSVYADPLPRAVIESMALAKPVVAFAVGGVVEMVEHGVTGRLVPFESARPGSEPAAPAAVERLADAFVRYAGDPALRIRDGQAGRLRILQDYDARAHAKRIQSEIVAASGLAAD